MSHSQPARTTRGSRTTVVAAVAVVGAALAGVLVSQSPASSSLAAAPTAPVAHGVPVPAVAGIASSRPTPGNSGPRDGRDGLDRRPPAAPPGAADGVLPDGTTVFDDGFPGMARLDPALLGALRRAAADAAGDGIRVLVTSGWRSPAYQEELLRQAILKYGSPSEAARWVATPTTSAHVSGNAVDVAPSDAAAWLSQHGAGFGLCQIYRNEPWHFELRPEAVGHGCPPMYADPTHDPRMQQ